jgi:hypothetical protein
VLLAIPSVLLLLLAASSAHAQSVIAGVVKDTSGAVIPGVTVEAASPALIEKTKSVTTDGDGLYRIVDLRPGNYTVTFTLSGFQSIIRDGINLPSDFTATVNVELKVGSLEESIIVSGAAPVVDVQSAARSQVVDAEAMRALPTGRNFQSFAGLLPGITLGTTAVGSVALDIGGARGSSQSYISARGLSPSETTFLIDGMQVSPGGAGQIYYPASMTQEISYALSSIPAEVGLGGVRINLIPRDGGNRYSGSFFGSYKNNAWQGSNLTDELVSRGLTRVDKFKTIYDVDASTGGPLKKDRVWFYTSHRRLANDLPVFGRSNPDGSAAVQGDRTWMSSMRLTGQVSPKNKLVGHYVYNGKNVDQVLQAGTNATSAGTSPEAAFNWRAPNYLAASVKWTSTLTNRLLLEAGPSVGYLHFKFSAQEGTLFPPFTDQWYAGASRFDITRVTRTTSVPSDSYTRNSRYYGYAALSYVTGTHTARFGTQISRATSNSFINNNANLVQQYRNGVPDSVIVQNYPIVGSTQLNYNVSLYGQDSWKYRRLTVNGGLRYEKVNAQVNDQDAPAGRWVPVRHFTAIKNLPNWNDIAPRLSLVYDLSGDGKTALKYSLNRYNQFEGASGVAPTYNPLAATTATLRWTDLNRDDVAQGTLNCAYLTTGCEIDFSTLPANFGTRALSRMDPDLGRTWTLENGVEIQHQLMPGLSVAASWNQTGFHDLALSYNTLQTFADYSPLSIFNPIDGSPITIYNLNPAKANAVDILDTSSSDVHRTFNSYTVDIKARMKGGVSLFGGLSLERVQEVTCARPDDPNLQRFCDDTESDLPWRPSFKLAGSYPLPYKITLSGSYQNLQGAFLGTRITAGQPISGATVLSLSRTSRYPANCPAPCPAGALIAPTLTQTTLVVPLTPYASEFTERVNELEFKVGREFTLHKVQIEPRFEMYNVLNSSAPTQYRSNIFGTATYNQVLAVPPARFAGIGVNVSF